MRNLFDKICISIGSGNFKQCMNILENSVLAELRLDMLNLSNKEIEQLLKTNCKIIATFRHGYSELSKAKETLLHAIRSGVNYVDIEVEADEEYFNSLNKEAKKYNCRTIVSYHNFKSTPSLDELNNIITNCKNRNTDIVKLATFINNSSDLSRLLSLYEQHNNLIAIGMGELGKTSRIAATELGAAFTYVSADNNLKTAEGQLSLSEYLQIKGILYGLNDEQNN